MDQLGYICTGLMGLVGLGVSGCWLAHIIVYMLPPIPIHPLLNEVFIKLDRVFPLFGVAAFAAFCGYLLGEGWQAGGSCVKHGGSWHQLLHLLRLSSSIACILCVELYWQPRGRVHLASKA
eukprot:GHRQ01025194.1.p2 GENE.GHRQ01025194.1~~GHRQ01025194.1.p2  ORF type:complete len:121 (+),score=30.58 GHRQ01025194.1:585-947(+)